MTAHGLAPGPSACHFASIGGMYARRLVVGFDHHMCDISDVLAGYRVATKSRVSLSLRPGIFVKFTSLPPSRNEVAGFPVVATPRFSSASPDICVATKSRVSL